MNCIYTEQRRKRLRRGIMGGICAAAAFAGGVFFCVSNPTMAANIPVIGHIFEEMQENFRYKGDYSDIGEPLEEGEIAFKLENSESAEEMEQISRYTKTADGLTVTLSEVYCNDQALYISMQMKAEEEFPGISGFQCNTTEKYSFNPTQSSDVPQIEGEFVDEHTFAGMLRFDLNSKIYDLSGYEAAREAVLAAGQEWDDNSESVNMENSLKTAEIPDEFTLELSIDKIYGTLTNPDKPDYGKTEEERLAMSDEEWDAFMNNWYKENPDWADFWTEHIYAVFDGPWEFTLNVKKNTSDTKVIELHDINDRGIGMEKIVKDRFEITMYTAYSNQADKGNYMPVMLDANAKLMEYGTGIDNNTVAIGDRDVSKVDVFLIGYDKWMYELKEIYWRNPKDRTEKDDRDFRQILLKECAYHIEVVFEE